MHSPKAAASAPGGRQSGGGQPSLDTACQQRAPKRPPARLLHGRRYTACQGLFNQFYTHLNAYMLASLLQATVVMPPAVRRQSFGKRFSIADPNANEVEWTPVPAGMLLDVEAMRRHWAQDGARACGSAAGSERCGGRGRGRWRRVQGPRPRPDLGPRVAAHGRWWGPQQTAPCIRQVAVHAAAHSLGVEGAPALSGVVWGARDAEGAAGSSRGVNTR